MKWISNLIGIFTISILLSSCLPEITPGGESRGFYLIPTHNRLYEQDAIDADITREITWQYENSPVFQPYHIIVITACRIVSLIGALPDIDKRSLAIRIARKTPDVYDVDAERLVVKPKIKTIREAYDDALEHMYGPGYFEGCPDFDITAPEPSTCPVDP